MLSLQNKSFGIAVLAIFIIMAPGCKKFIQVEPSSDLIRTEVVFQNDQTAIAAASQVYLYMRVSTQFFTNGGMSFYGGLSADELSMTFTISNYDVFLKNSLTSKDPTIFTNFWLSAYKNIYTINSIIEGVSNSTNLTPSTKNQLLGEMKVVRSWYYFYLLNLFGPVPLILETDYQTNALVPRTPEAEIYQQIINDLIEAKSLLSENYPSAGKARPNKFTATALLSRVYLYLENWEQAELEASEIINSTVYNLVTDLNEVFLINSPETIWEIAPDNETSNTVDAQTYIPYSTSNVPVFILTDFLMNSFEAGDQRKEFWVGKNTTTTPPYDYYYPFKYKNNEIGQSPTEYTTVIRLDEQYLIRAEARTHQDKYQEAQDDLNQIRLRAGLPPSVAITQTDLFGSIEHERQVELFMEWGHRWLDLKRTGRIDVVLAAEKGGDWQSTDAFYPIPYDELLRNPNLTQNQGY